uniref:Uncharacterized protein n=2 Tax=Populus trichocarpa TaxID=3694 RepID=A0A3N7FAN1_POPTR
MSFSATLSVLKYLSPEVNERRFMLQQMKHHQDSPYESISLPSVSIMLATTKPFSSFNILTCSVTLLCHSRVLYMTHDNLCNIHAIKEPPIPQIHKSPVE